MSTTARLIIDIHTNRIIYYTEDLSVQLYPNDHTFIIDFQEKLPEGLDLLNSWEYVYEQHRVTYKPWVETYSYEEKLFEYNKKSLLSFLVQKINSLRQELEPDCILGHQIREIIYNSIETSFKYTEEDQLIIDKYNKQKQILLKTESMRLYLKKKILNAINTMELDNIREEIHAL